MKYLNLIILLLFLLACQDKKKDEIKHLVSEWQGKEIRFPKDMVFARFATDTVDFTLSIHLFLIRLLAKREMMFSFFISNRC